MSYYTGNTNNWFVNGVRQVTSGGGAVRHTYTPYGYNPHAAPQPVYAYQHGYQGYNPHAPRPVYTPQKPKKKGKVGKNETPSEFVAIQLNFTILLAVAIIPL